jgi:RNA polymerase sigma factor (sigma-70 family)
MTCQRNHAPGLSWPFDELSDETLLQALAEGAAWAMEPLYQRYHQILYALAYRLVVDSQVAEDLVQEAFLNLWQHAASYAPQIGPVRRWLIAILYHRAIDYLRRYRRRHASCKEVPWEEVEQDEGMAGPDVWEQVWHLLQLTQVHEALRQLPIEQRLLIELAYLQAWTHQEIAEHYQLPLGTVKARIRLGLVHLKRALEQREGCNRT